MYTIKAITQAHSKAIMKLGPPTWKTNQICWCGCRQVGEGVHVVSGRRVDPANGTGWTLFLRVVSGTRSLDLASQKRSPTRSLTSFFEGSLVCSASSAAVRCGRNSRKETITSIICYPRFIITEADLSILRLSMIRTLLFRSKQNSRFDLITAYFI